MAEKKYEYMCDECGIVERHPRWYVKQKKYPNLCGKCARLKAAASYKEIKQNDPGRWSELTRIKQEAARRKHKKYTKQERIEHAKKMRSAVKLSGTEMRAKQQEFIDNAGDEYYQRYCDKRKKISQDFHNGMTDEQREQHYRKVFKNRGRSKECDEFMTVLQANGIVCDVEQYVRGFVVDGIIRNTHVVIEYYGDMFHCNPRKFHDPEQVCSWLSGRTVQEQWDRDKRRLAALYRYGYKVIVVWGSDWKDNPEKVLRRIRNEMHQC
jgi:G:T-mismatch repair DNA endonuclease (very short patch repair protein)